MQLRIAMHEESGVQHQLCIHVAGIRTERPAGVICCIRFRASRQTGTHLLQVAPAVRATSMRCKPQGSLLTLCGVCCN
jgi:hypothetical protein